MTDNDENGVRRDGPKVRLRFSLLALLIFVTLVCLFLAWLVQPNRVVATALFQIESTTPTVLNPTAGQKQDAQDFEIFKKTQLALLKSEFVLAAAVRNPAIAALSIFHGTSDPVAWLQNHLEVSFPEDAEILAIQLHGTEAQAKDLLALTDAVAKAYKDEVISDMRERRLVTRDLLERNLENLKADLKHKLDDFLAIARDSRQASETGQVFQDLDIKRLDRIDSELMRLETNQAETLSSEKGEKQKSFDERIAQLHKRQSEMEAKLKTSTGRSADLEMRQKELAQLQDMASEMSASLERLDIEAASPDRIRQVQPAIMSRQ